MAILRLLLLIIIWLLGLVLPSGHHDDELQGVVTTQPICCTLTIEEFLAR